MTIINTILSRALGTSGLKSGQVSCGELLFLSFSEIPPEQELALNLFNLGFICLKFLNKRFNIYI